MEREASSGPEKSLARPCISYATGLRFITTIATCINGIFTFSLIGYFFWLGFFYLIGSIGMAFGWIYLAPRVRDEIACPSITIYTNSLLWAVQGLVMLITCYSYSSVVDEDFENKLYTPTKSINILGFLVKVGPSIVRFSHLFTLCLIFTNIFNILFLPECNCAYIRRVVAYSVVIWWIISVLGIIAKGRIKLPPYLYNPYQDRNTLYNIQISLNFFGI